ncbi:MULTISPECIES: hypothetical protein [unclassified Microcoleus]|uniref:hypothetical protein n=1 Tax=unclassified Microcoleus TaxID=2642155 RepID=UPI002FD47456
MKKVIVAILSIAAIALPQSAIAQTVFFNGLDRILQFEGTANSPFAAEIWTLKTVAVTANACGLATVRTLPHSMQFLTIAGNQVDYSALPVQTIPACSGTTLAESRPSNFKLADGRTVLVGQSGSVSVQFLARSTKSGTFNACGLRNITVKNANAIGSDSIPVVFGGQTQSLGDINQVTSLAICKKVGNTSVKYIKL